MRRSSSGPVALGAPVGFPDAVVPFPIPGACTPGFTGRLRGARGGRPRTGLIVPAAGPHQARGAGLAPRRTHSGPRARVVPGGSLRRRSWAACAAVVGVCGRRHRRVWFPVLPVFRRGTRPVHRGCFVWTPTSPLAGRRTPRPGPVRVCVCSSFLAGSRRRASRARFGAPPLFLWPLCLSALLGLLRARVAPFVVLCLPSPCCCSPGPPPPFFCFCAPFVSCFLWFPAPAALGLGALFFFPPPPRPLFFCFFFAPPLSLAFSGVRPQVPRALALCAVCFARLPPLGSPCPLAPPAAPWWLLPPRPPPSSFVSRGFRCCLLVLGFFCAPPLSLAFTGFRPRLPWALALWPVCFVGLPLLCSLCALVLCVPPRRWPLFGGCCPPPPRLLSAAFVAAARCSFSFFPSLVPRRRCLFPRCLLLSLVSGPGAVGLDAVCCLFWWLSASRLAVRSRLVCVSRLAVGCSLVVAVPPQPPLCLAVFVAASGCSVFFCAPAVCGFRWFPAPGALGLGAVCSLFFFASRLPARCALLPPMCLQPGRGLLPGVCCPRPPFFVSQFLPLPLGARFFFRCAPPLSLPFSGFRPRLPWALALCVVCSPLGWLWCPVFCFVLRRVAFSCGLWCVLCCAVLSGVLVSG